MDTHCRERGFGLIEILVAVAIGLILVGGIIQVFMSTRLGYQMDSGLARLQENARAAIDFTSYDVRMAGFMGCPNLDNLTPNNILDPVQYPGLTFNPADAIAGHEYTGSTWAPALPAALSGLSSPPLADTDVVRIQMGTSCGAYLTGNMTADNANIQITEPNDCGFAAADPLLITD